jgi:hypothetical protein
MRIPDRPTSAGESIEERLFNACASMPAQPSGAFAHASQAAHDKSYKQKES